MIHLFLDWAYTQKKQSQLIMEKICIPVFTVPLFTLAKILSTSSCPLMNEIVQEICYKHTHTHTQRHRHTDTHTQTHKIRFHITIVKKEIISVWKLMEMEIIMLSKINQNHRFHMGHLGERRI
jgi:hypothetical protein